MRHSKPTLLFAYQSFEELAHGLEIELIAAIEHDTLHRECFREILGGFGLACSGRTFGRPTVVQVVGAH